MTLSDKVGVVIWYKAYISLPARNPRSPNNQKNDYCQTSRSAGNPEFRKRTYMLPLQHRKFPCLMESLVPYIYLTGGVNLWFVAEDV
jgi:hypothetical protein